MSAWDKADQAARYLLYQRLPDAIVLSFGLGKDAQTCWRQVSVEYQAKSLYAQADLEQTFLDMRCAKGGGSGLFMKSPP